MCQRVWNYHCITIKRIKVVCMFSVVIKNVCYFKQILILCFFLLILVWNMIRTCSRQVATKKKVLSSFKDTRVYPNPIWLCFVEHKKRSLSDCQPLSQLTFTVQYIKKDAIKMNGNWGCKCNALTSLCGSLENYQE